MRRRLTRRLLTILTGTRVEQYPPGAFMKLFWVKRSIPTSDLQCAMRRAGQNPTDVEVFLQKPMSNIQCPMLYTQCPMLCIQFNAYEPMFSGGQVQDMVNKIDDGSGVLDFEDFLLVIFLIFFYSLLLAPLSERCSRRNQCTMAKL